MLQTLTEWQFLLLNEMTKEYEKGMLALNSVPAQTVTFYGGARIKEGTETFKQTFDLAKALSERGWGIVTGGGPGIMEAGIKGAKAGGGKSVAFRIDLPNEQRQVEADFDVLFKHFSARKYMLRQSDVFVYAPRWHWNLG
jgi:predicted Rossmann-fold nucleotide-binding protein